MRIKRLATTDIENAAGPKEYFSGLRQRSLNDIAEIYKNISSQIFSQSPLKGTSNLVWSHSYYDTALWEKILREQWGEELLINTAKNLKTPKVSVKHNMNFNIFIVIKFIVV